MKANSNLNSALTAIFVCCLLSAMSPFAAAAQIQSQIDNVESHQTPATLVYLPAAPSDTPPKPRTSKIRTGDMGSRPKKKWLEFRKKGGVVYRETDEYQLKCDLYIPEGDGPFPAILAVHGGAWRQGTKLTMLRHAWRMAGSGYVVVAINYRHAPKYPFPAQVHDCKDAIRWMRANAGECKIDAQCIGAYGYSAGGHLVSMIGTTDANDGLEGEAEPGFEKFDTRVKAVVAGGAPCDFSWIEDDSRVLTYWLGGSRNKKPEAFRMASPTSFVSADDPPFFFYHGDSDFLVPVDSSKLLHQKLLGSNVESEHFTLTNTGHLGAFSDLDWMDKAIEFFDKHLK